MAEPLLPFQFDDNPIDEARAMGRGWKRLSLLPGLANRV
jgi:hypothetical protein